MSDRCILGADVGGTAVKFVLLDDAGGDPRLRARCRPIPATARAPWPAWPGRWPRPRRRPGRRWAWPAPASSIRTRGRLGRSPNLPGWQDSDLGGALGRAFAGLPTALANDVNAALYGEHRAGAGRGCRNLVMLALGTGVGGGVILDGRLLVGAHSGRRRSATWSWIPTGPLCACGNRGCLEAYAGSRALLVRARELAAPSRAAGRPGAAAGGAADHPRPGRAGRSRR